MEVTVFAFTPPTSLEDTSLATTTLEDIPPRHPVHMLSSIFFTQLVAQPRQKLPQLNAIISETSDELLAYCMILSPIPGRPFLDFRIIANGGRLPGAETANLRAGDCYSEQLLPDRVAERLTELASCIILRRHRLTRALSARRSMLNVKVFRGVYPVWHEEQRNYAVILSFAPRYVEI